MILIQSDEDRCHIIFAGSRLGIFTHQAVQVFLDFCSEWLAVVIDQFVCDVFASFDSCRFFPYSIRTHHDVTHFLAGHDIDVGKRSDNWRIQITIVFVANVPKSTGNIQVSLDPTRNDLPSWSPYPYVFRRMIRTMINCFQKNLVIEPINNSFWVSGIGNVYLIFSYQNN